MLLVEEEGILKKAGRAKVCGPRRDAFVNAEGVGRENIFNNPWLVMVTGRSAQEL